MQNCIFAKAREKFSFSGTNQPIEHQDNETYMTIAIISDIHGNLEAFKAVIADLEQRGISTVYCLGDLIGYGPDPEEVVQLFQHQGYHSVIGNHEAALHQKKMQNWLNFKAKENSIITEELMSVSSVDFCTSLPTSLQVGDAHLVHGFPPDSVLSYATMMDDNSYINYFTKPINKLCFVGHTHDLLIVSFDGHHLERKNVSTERITLRQDRQYIVNVGSVGQPRDGNNNAKYILWNPGQQWVEVVFIPYDYQKTVQKIRQRNFPEAYGLRLR